jgi:hypothetical protein
VREYRKSGGMLRAIFVQCTITFFVRSEILTLVFDAGFAAKSPVEDGMAG